GANNPSRVGFPPEVLSFRLLCTEEKVGGVIGKGGSVIKALQRETGCEVNVLDGGVDSEDRIIIISGPAVWFLFSFFYYSCLRILFFL
ncbi:KH domain-containing protein, partial [Shigella flexneri]|nr:KH domain-containing protein [Shigella flexneri]